MSPTTFYMQKPLPLMCHTQGQERRQTETLKDDTCAKSIKALQPWLCITVHTHRGQSYIQNVLF